MKTIFRIFDTSLWDDTGYIKIVKFLNNGSIHYDTVELNQATEFDNFKECEDMICRILEQNSNNIPKIFTELSIVKFYTTGEFEEDID